MLDSLVEVLVLLTRGSSMGGGRGLRTLILDQAIQFRPETPRTVRSQIVTRARRQRISHTPGDYRLGRIVFPSKRLAHGLAYCGKSFPNKECHVIHALVHGALRADGGSVC